MTEAERAINADLLSAHLPKPNVAMLVSESDVGALCAAFKRRFDEELPRTATLMAVARIGYRMALRDADA